MSSSQRIQCLLSLCFIGLDVLCFYALKKRNKNRYIENENEKKKKKMKKEELQCLHAFTGFTAWTSSSGQLDGEIARMKLVSLSLLPFYFQ